MTRLRRALVTASLLAVQAAATAAVTAALDRDQLAPGESVQLTLQHDGRTSTQPDLGPLATDFDVVGRSSGSSVQIINGSMSTQQTVQLTLVPRRSGTLTIPPLTWDGQVSQPLSLAVGRATEAPAGAGAGGGPAAPVFFTTALAPAQPYVQAATVLTVRVHTAQQLLQASLGLPDNSDVRVQQLGKDQLSTETRDGRTYQVIERRYVLFPQRSGTLKLEGPVLDAQVAAASRLDPMFGQMFGQMPLPGFMGGTRPLRLHGEPIALTVRPRPASQSGGHWLPATQVSLTGTWEPADGAVRVGEPLTLHLHLRATGAGAEQLPDLAAALALPEGLKAYPDQAKLDSTAQADTLVGQRDQDVAVIASHAGTFTVPALRLAWWDTAHDAAREAVLPAHTVVVQPAVASATAPGATTPVAPSLNAPTPTAPVAATPVAAASTPAAPVRPQWPRHDALPWPWISLGLAVLWLATVLAWWWRHRRAQAVQRRAAPAASRPPGHAAQALRRARQACEADTPHPARQALLAWAAVEWPDHPPQGLQALADRLHDAALTEPLRALDRACFMGGPWQGQALAQALANRPAPAGAVPAADPLGALYP